MFSAALGRSLGYLMQGGLTGLDLNILTICRAEFAACGGGGGGECCCCAALSDILLLE